MIDRVLGRASLKEHIAALEDEKESLEAQLEAERDRRREAARKRQDAEERVNRLEDRIAELEDRVERAETEESGVAFRGKATIRGDRLERTLSRLESVETGAEGALSAMVVDEVPDELRDLLGDRAALVARAAPALVYVDDEQVVSAALRPPVAPDPFLEWGRSFRIEREWFQPRGRYALALVRADLFAVGVYQAGEQLSFEGFDSDVKGDHSKGGFSQARFERRRDQQIDDHLDAARVALESVDADRLFVVGEQTAIGSFEDVATVLSPVDATGKPREALEDAFDSFWSVQLRLL